MRDFLAAGAEFAAVLAQGKRRGGLTGFLKSVRIPLLRCAERRFFKKLDDR
jgi:hypothetical protein